MEPHLPSDMDPVTAAFDDDLGSEGRLRPAQEPRQKLPCGTHLTTSALSKVQGLGGVHPYILYLYPNRPPHTADKGPV